MGHDVKLNFTLIHGVACTLAVLVVSIMLIGTLMLFGVKQRKR